MSHPTPDSPDAGDVDTESLYGQPPEGGSPAADEESADSTEVPGLGEEDDLRPGSTGSLDQG